MRVDDPGGAGVAPSAATAATTASSANATNAQTAGGSTPASSSPLAGDTLQPPVAADKTSVPNVLSSVTGHVTDAAGGISALKPFVPEGRLAPNASIVENGYTSTTDQFGRLKSIEGQLSLNPGVRNATSQQTVGWADRLSTDQGGHGIATRFNGPSGYNNLVAQDKNLNLSAYKRMENDLARHVQAGDKVSAKVTYHYDEGGLRPTHIQVNSTINGRKFTNVFANKANVEATSVLGDVGTGESALNTVGKVAKSAEVIGKVAGPLAAAADAYQMYGAFKQDGDTIGHHTVEAAGSVAGGWAGAAYGAEIGAAVGAEFGGVGAIPGAIIGGAVGGLVGSKAGEDVVKLGEDAIDAGKKAWSWATSWL
jgi:hypothetical protein